MHKRTFFRILTDNIFINNPFCRALIALVNFCKEYSENCSPKLKFLEKMPLKRKETVNCYKNRFVFDSSKMYGVNSK